MLPLSLQHYGQRSLILCEFRVMGQVLRPMLCLCRAFFTAAGWFNALLREREHVSLFPLERWVTIGEVHCRMSTSPFHIEFDGSPWGGGAVLFRGASPVEYFAIPWDVDILH